MTKHDPLPDSTAVCVALWRAMHAEVDPPPHVIRDEIGLMLAAPDDAWRSRPDMEPRLTSRFRASIVARARFVEDLVAEQAALGARQYVILGAGLDSFAQRHPDIASRLRLFELDQPGAQAWKRQRLAELGFDTPESLRFVPVDFEADWWGRLTAGGFDPAEPAIVASIGVTLYLSREAVKATFERLATLARGSCFVTTFEQPLSLVEPEERPLREATEHFAREAGTPFLSFFAPEDLQNMARQAGFVTAEHVSAAQLAERYFSQRTDGLRPSSSEEIMVARTSAARC